MSAPVPIPSPSEPNLRFLDPTDAQIALAIATIVHDTYDGHVVLERRKNGNVDMELRRQCASDFVLIPGPMRFAEVLQELLARSSSSERPEWTVFVKDMFTTELYPSGTMRLPSQIPVQGQQA